MFSKNKASPVMLIIPLALIILIGFLSFQIVNKSNAKAPSNSQNDVNTETTNTGSNSNMPQDSSNATGQKTQKENDLDTAMNAAPKSAYPENTCADGVVTESGARYFALKGTEKFTLTQEGKDWIVNNCPDVKTLEF